MKRSLLLLLMILSGCSTTPNTSQAVLTPFNQFNLGETQLRMSKGKGVVQGQASAHLATGVVATCAGNEVRLYPGTSYAQERFSMEFSSTDDSSTMIARSSAAATSTVAAPPQEYEELTWTTTCDSNGQFKFEHLPDGNFIVVAAVKDTADATIRLAQKVAIKDAAPSTATLTH